MKCCREKGYEIEWKEKKKLRRVEWREMKQRGMTWREMKKSGLVGNAVE